MSKDELIRILSKALPEDADITYASATWWDDIGCHNWSTDIEIAIKKDGEPYGNN